MHHSETGIQYDFVAMIIENPLRRSLRFSGGNSETKRNRCDINDGVKGVTEC